MNGVELKEQQIINEHFWDKQNKLNDCFDFISNWILLSFND
jgi:hypothetical protein